MTQRRIFQCSFPYFVTFNAFDDINMFEDIKKGEILHKIILKAGELKNHLVYQFCIMPDHVHILCKTESPSSQNISCRVGFPTREAKWCDGSGDPQYDQPIANGIADWKVHSAININNFTKNNCDCGQKHKFNISNFIKSIRGTFSRMIYEGQIWQPRFYDQIIDNNERLSATINYITCNPIKAGISKKWQKYPYQFKNDELINDLL